MTARAPIRVLPPSHTRGPQTHIGLSWFPTAESMGFPATPFVIGAGATQDSQELWTPGFNNFMLIWNIVSAGFTFSYVILDPETLAPVASQVIVVAPATNVVTFGALSATALVPGRAHNWIAWILRIVDGGAGSTVNALWLQCGVR